MTDGTSYANFLPYAKSTTGFSFRSSSNALSIAQALSGLMIDKSAVQGWSGVKVCCMNSTVTENERKRIILRANELVIKNRFFRFAFA